MITFDSLLYRGFFPRELPPAFTTETFASVLLNNAHALPQEFGTSSTTIAHLLGHSVARLGIARRYMCIPNPIPYLRLCREIANHWTTIETHCQQSLISKSTPTDNQRQGRAIITASDFDDLLEFRSQLRSTSRYILKTDISKFYPSIYTHSIAWALHTKSYAKGNRRNRQLVGNILDLCVRNCQDTQTIGIPIGPDTSLVISEIVLSAIDVAFHRRMPHVKGFRFVDDYEFGVLSYSMAEETLLLLQETLKDFELNLNFGKTRILELPVPLDPLWVSELRSFTFRQTQRTQKSDLVHYFSKAFELAALNQDDFVLKYAIARLRGLRIDSANWDIVQDFLFQCLMCEPSTFLVTLERLMEAHQNGFPINLGQVDEAMNYQIAYNSPTGKTSEVAWALWALIFWSVPLNQLAADSVSRVEDSIVALLSLDAEIRGLIPSGLDHTLWESFMTEQDLVERQWLLAYEASVKNWLPSVGGVDHIANNPSFDFLSRNGV